MASAESAQSNVTSGSRALSTNSAPSTNAGNKSGLDSDEDETISSKNPEEGEKGGKLNIMDLMAKYMFKTYSEALSKMQ